jgi:uncharacterized protein with PIN domain
MRFAADRMLGKLAKWLRMLGYDTLYSSALSDDRFLELAKQGRILLSRNTRIVGKMVSNRLIIVKGNDPKTQLKGLVRLLGLRPNPNDFFSRCIVCNGLIEPVERQDVAGKVPDHLGCVRQKAFLLRGELEAGTNGESETASRRIQVVNWNVDNN